MQITDKQRKEIDEIKLEVARLALRLRHLHQEDDAGEDHPLWQASSLIHAGQQKLQSFLDPEHAGDIEWQRKTHPGVIDSGTF